MRPIRNLLSGLTVLAVLVFLIFTFWMRDGYVVPVITYHHVSDAASGDFLNNVTPRSFARQMEFLKKHRYNVISFDDLVDGLKKGRAFARDTLVIQFDDGYEDNYTNALPVLKQYHFPAVGFLISDMVGTPGFLTWDQVREMEAQGFKAGAHTRHHVYLPDVSPDTARDEIFGSKKVIEEHLGHTIDHFCYPSGGFTGQVQGIVREAGFKAAVTTNRGPDRLNRDLFALRRIRIKNGDNALTLWAKLSGYYNFFRKTKDAY